MPHYKHVFFDLDHTLWDFERNSEAALRHVFLHFSLEEQLQTDFISFLKSFSSHNERLWERFRRGFMTRKDLRWKRVWHTLLDFKVGSKQLAESVSKMYIDILPLQGLLMPHAHSILEYCKQKEYRLHLITNGFEATQTLKLKVAEIIHYFEHIVTSEVSNSMKPHPEIFEYALFQVNAEAVDCLMIGDALEIDILGAKNVGMDQVYYNPHAREHTQHPTYEIDCLSQLSNIL